MPFKSQEQIQIARRQNFNCHPDVFLRLSLDQFVVCWDCHVTSLARSTWVVCSKISSVLLSKLSRYANQRSNQSNQRKPTKRQSFGDWWILAKTLLQNCYFRCFSFSVTCVVGRFLESLSVGLRIHRTGQRYEILSPSLSVNTVT